MKKEHKNSERAHLMVDIESMLPEKVRRWMPRFMIKRLLKIVHEDDINDGIATVRCPQGINFFGDALKFLDITFEVRGVENLPGKGDRCVFASNHPLGGPEALILGEVMRQFYGESFRVPVNAILGAFPPLNDFFVPVNALSAKQSKSVSEGIANMFKSEYQVLVYPAGRCSRWRGNRVVTEMEWKKMFVSQARKYGRDVVPLHCSGINSDKFYRLTRMSERLGLKVSLGMLYLVDELFKHRGKRFVFTFGERISYESFDKSKTDKQWAEVVRQRVVELGRDNGEPQNMGL